MSKMGRPPKTSEISLEKIIEIMMEAAEQGWFFQQLPAEIYEKTGVKVSMSHLEGIRDEEFLRSKDIAFSKCTKFWTAQMMIATVHQSVWFKVMHHVGKWQDTKHVVLDATVEKTENEAQRIERIERVKLMLKEASR